MCKKILNRLLELHVNPKSKNIVWNPYKKKEKRNKLLELKSTRHSPHDVSFYEKCPICREWECPFECNRNGICFLNHGVYDNVDKYYWKIANMFMFRGKERNSFVNTGPEDTDSALIFKMMKNCKLFMFGEDDETEIEEGGNDKDNSDNSNDDGPSVNEEADNETYDELLEVRTFLMHSPDNRLSNESLDECFKLMKTILRADKFKDDWSKQAVDELSKLQSMTMIMTSLTSEEAKIVNEAFAIQKFALEYDINLTGKLKNDRVLEGILKVNVEKSEKYRDPEKQDPMKQDLGGVPTEVAMTIGAIIGAIGGPPGAALGATVGGLIGKFTN